MNGEKTLTPAYWRLGQVLVRLKKSFGHGQWERHLKELRIDQTRASKAMAIHKTFVKEEEAAQFRVDEAYAKRAHKQRQKKTDSSVASREDAEQLQKSIGLIAKSPGR